MGLWMLEFKSFIVRKKRSSVPQLFEVEDWGGVHELS